jgi:hyperosmotically inducible periplasmic protein
MTQMKGRGILAALIVGAVAEYFLDPQLGRRRRALAGDRVSHVRAALPRHARAVVRKARGQLKGARYSFPGFADGAGEADVLDDVGLKQRVESELGANSSLRLPALNFDAVDGIVRIRGQAPDARTAQEIVEKTARVSGVRAVVSLMRLADGTPAGGMAGDLEYLDAGPRAKTHGVALKEKLLQRWPSLSDDDIVESNGHLGRLVATITARTGEPPNEVRVAIEEMLLAAV